MPTGYVGMGSGCVTWSAKPGSWSGECITRSNELTENTALTNIDENALVAMDQAIESCSLAALQSLSPVRRTLVLARGMQTLRRHMTGQVMDDIRGLANTRLGFLTDRPPGATDKHGKTLKPYSDDVLRDCIIDGMLRGASPIGNEINVIAGSCYLTRQYFERTLATWPGLSGLRIVEGVPATSVSSGGALVPMRASWSLYGACDEIVCDKTADGDYRIPVRINAGMGADAILGKGKRKLLAKVVARLSGSQWVAQQAESDEVEAIEGPMEVATEQLSPAAENLEQETDAAFVEPIQHARKSLAACTTLRDVDSCQREWRPYLDAEQQLEVEAACNERRDAIRVRTKNGGVEPRSDS